MTPLASLLHPLLRALILGLGSACMALAPAWAMDWAALVEQARARADQAWQAPGHALPPALAGLNYDQMRALRFRPERAIWREQNLPFEVQAFHLGLYHTEPVRLHEVGPDGQVRTLPYRRDDFETEGILPADADLDGLGLAGFRLHHPLNRPDHKDELIVFLGASYFRALGAGQQYGLSARGLAIDTVGGQGEEFPRFTDFWLIRPDPQAREITLYALLESPRATGAYRFVIRPGAPTTTTVSLRLFLRRGAAPIHTLGLAPLTSMFLSGENQPLPGDFRPEVHDSDGLSVVTGEGEWLWRPLQRPGSVVVTSFTTVNPQGFGLMQRDRDFNRYEDVEARYERRPSAWVRPLGAWGEGRVELVLLPTPDETHDNVVAYWVPQTLPPVGEPLSLDYEIAWQGDDFARPSSSWVTQSRRGHGYTRLSPAQQAAQPKFILDFAGPALDALPPGATVTPVVSARDGEVLEAIAYPHPTTGRWRLSLRVARHDPARPVELRAFLQHQQHTVSETWTYLLLPE